MNVAITGASGLIGRTFAASCVVNGHAVRRVVRGEPAAGDVAWDPSRGWIGGAALAGMDVVVHLAGEPLASGRWTREKKRRIVESRERGTRLLCEAIAGMEPRPRVLLSASAIGIYGSRGEEVLEEGSPPGNGFLAEVCRRWEAATIAAERAGIRVVHLRIGVVLDRDGGALRQMLPVFRAGVGGRLGSGRQWLSWIALEDVVAAMWHAIDRDDLVGALNLAAPEPVRNGEFTQALAGVLKRPAILPVPAWVLRLAVGGMADEAILSSARVVPRRLLESSFEFSRPTLIGCLRDTLGR